MVVRWVGIQSHNNISIVEIVVLVPDDLAPVKEEVDMGCQHMHNNKIQHIHDIGRLVTRTIGNPSIQ